MKAIKIDVENQAVYQIEIGKDYREIYTAIGNNCTCFAVPVNFDNGDCMYVDDEALLRDDIKGGFTMPDWVTPIIGNAIILGTDEDGESVDCMYDVHEIVPLVRFIDQQRCLDHRDDSLSKGPTIISF